MTGSGVTVKASLAGGGTCVCPHRCPGGLGRPPASLSLCVLLAAAWGPSPPGAVLGRTGHACSVSPSEHLLWASEPCAVGGALHYQAR